MRTGILALMLSLFPGLAQSAQPIQGPAVEGYTDRLSYVAGETVKLHVSTAEPRFNVEIVREGTKREVVWTRAGIPGKEYPVPADASSQGCRWPSVIEFEVPPSWRPGYYSMSLREEGDPKRDKILANRTDPFFVVRSSEPGRHSSILLQLSTNTYNAYNNWGGTSLYAYNGKNKVQGRRVSFDRPPATQFRNWELPFVQWAEDHGYVLDYAVNSDLEDRPEILSKYKLVLSVGHDEYWSAPMRDHLEAFIARGGNVAFLSGNSVCWQVRSEDQGRALVCWKQAFKDDPLYSSQGNPKLSTLWSHHLVGRPENTLTGVGFLYGGYHKSHGQFMQGTGGYNVHRPEHWLFEGTGLKEGQAFGVNDTIVGYECDGCDFTLRDGKPEPTHRDGTPDSFVILATAEARWHPDDCEWYDRWEKGRLGHAVLGTYTRPGCGTVVTTGSTDWAHGLKGKDPVVSRITKNILDRLSK